LDYGEHGGRNDTANLAVALRVGDDSHDNGYIPSAVEFDIDSKPTLGAVTNKYWFALYACWILTLALVLGMLGAVIVVRSTRAAQSSAGPLPAALPERATVGIRESIRQFLGESSAHLLDDPSHAYRQALDWIQNDDPMALTPARPDFVQRYLLAYLYYSTTARGPWNTGCDPESLLSSTNSSDADNKDDCTHEYTDVVLPEVVYRVAAKKWLSDHDECQWGGIVCDATGHVVELMFSTCLVRAVLHDSHLAHSLTMVVLSLSRWVQNDGHIPRRHCWATNVAVRVVGE
jgi:hypothetical protein